MMKKGSRKLSSNKSQITTILIMKNSLDKISKVHLVLYVHLLCKRAISMTVTRRATERVVLNAKREVWLQKKHIDVRPACFENENGCIRYIEMCDKVSQNFRFAYFCKKVINNDFKRICKSKSHEGFVN